MGQTIFFFDENVLERLENPVHIKEKSYYMKVSMGQIVLFIIQLNPFGIKNETLQEKYGSNCIVCIIS